MGNYYNDSYNTRPLVDIQPSRGRLLILSEKYLSFWAVMHGVLNPVRWLIGFFTLSEEDQLKAGIDVGGEKRDVETGPTHSFPR
jgi:hypothetical protein